MKTPCVFQVAFRHQLLRDFPSIHRCFLDHIETMQIARMMYNVGKPWEHGDLMVIYP